MRLIHILWDETAESHIWARHRVTPEEVEEAAFAHGLAIRGRARGIYEVFGQTEVGRHLLIVTRSK